MGKDELIILLGFLLVLKAAIDWIQIRDEIEEMQIEEENDETDKSSE
ncbi:MAG: hypothetical protein J5959_05020 [Butyrivibrio sp.]|nr:hypothetical protein [Butyrivibrio sp.]MBP3816903.1 hypothetical protein [Butyrivibrio sp.]